MRGKLHWLIFVGMIGGAVLGMLLWLLDDGPTKSNALWLLDLFGKTIFVGFLKMIVAPLIFASIVAAVVSLGNPKELGRIGVKTLLFYAATTTIAVTIGLLSLIHI